MSFPNCCNLFCVSRGGVAVAPSTRCLALVHNVFVMRAHAMSGGMYQCTMTSWSASWTGDWLVVCHRTVTCIDLAQALSLCCCWWCLVILMFSLRLRMVNAILSQADRVKSESSCTVHTFSPVNWFTITVTGWRKRKNVVYVVLIRNMFRPN